MKKGKYLQKVLDEKKSSGGSTTDDVEKVSVQRERQKKSGSAFTRIQ
jgi:hypothetical protein